MSVEEEVEYGANVTVDAGIELGPVVSRRRGSRHPALANTCAPCVTCC